MEVNKGEVNQDSEQSEPVISTAAATNSPAVEPDGETAEDVDPLEIGTVTVENFSTTEEPRTTHPNDVRFKVSYPKNWEGEKPLPEGSIQIVSKESAEHFTSLKFGRVIK
jgi:hypothetical protein